MNSESLPIVPSIKLLPAFDCTLLGCAFDFSSLKSTEEGLPEHYADQYLEIFFSAAIVSSVCPKKKHGME